MKVNKTKKTTKTKTAAKAAPAKLTKEQELGRIKINCIAIGVFFICIGLVFAIVFPPAILIACIAIPCFKKSKSAKLELEQLKKENEERAQREAEEKAAAIEKQAQMEREAAERAAQAKEIAERAAAEKAAKIKECQDRVATDPAEYKRLQDLCKTIHTEYTNLMKELRADLKDIDLCDMDNIIWKLKECWRKLEVIETNITYYGVYELDIFAEQEKVEKLAKSAVNKYIKSEKDAGVESYDIDVYQFRDLHFISDFVWDKIDKLERY